MASTPAPAAKARAKAKASAKSRGAAVGPVATYATGGECFRCGQLGHRAAECLAAITLEDEVQLSYDGQGFGWEEFEDFDELDYDENEPNEEEQGEVLGLIDDTDSDHEDQHTVSSESISQGEVDALL